MTKKKAKAKKSTKKAPPKKKAKIKPMVFIEVLQNGETLGQYSCPLGMWGSIKIGSKRGAHVFLPHYPLAETFNFLYMRRNGLHIDIDQHWEGFVFTGGKMRELNQGPAERQIRLKNGEYASIYVDELNFLIRVGAERRETKRVSARHPAYRGKLMPLIFGGKIEVQVMAAALIATIALLGPLFAGMYTQTSARMTSFNDLDPSYIVGFFNPMHLKTAPEALHENIDRTNYFRSVFSYYEALAGMLAGWKDFERKYVFASTLKVNEEIRQAREEKLNEKVQAQLNAEDRLFSKPKTAIMSIPAVRGESLQGQISRIIDKIDIIHKNLEENLELRRSITKSFPNDTTYEFGNYKNLGMAKVDLSALSKIDAFELLTDEETMYRVAEDLAKLAAKKQPRFARAKAYLEGNKGPIGIPSGVQYASFLNNASYLADDRKIDGIDASTFGTPVEKQEKIKEPLIGEISPALIERVIDRNKYELQLCFELALRRNQLVDGQMEFSWRIDSRGQISELELVSTDIRDRNLVRCVREKIAGWNFPRPKRGSVSVTYPFHFSKSRG